MGEEIAFKMAKFRTFIKVLWARDLDLDLHFGSGHTAYRHASLIDLYIHTKFHGNRRNFLWTEGRTYGLDGHFIPTVLGRLGG